MKSEEVFLHGVLSERESVLLDRPEGTPYSIIESTGYIDNNVPLWWGETHHRPDEELYSVRFSVSGQSGELGDNSIVFDFHD